MPSSPTARTLAHLRRHGYTVDVAERWLPRVNRKRDLFGLFDLVALDRREHGIIGIQVTSMDRLGDRLKRLQTRPELLLWLRCGGQAWVMGWAKRAGRWRVKIVAVQAQDLAAVPILAPKRRRGRAPRQRGLFE